MAVGRTFLTSCADHRHPGTPLLTTLLDYGSDERKSTSERDLSCLPFNGGHFPKERETNKWRLSRDLLGGGNGEISRLFLLKTS